MLTRLIAAATAAALSLTTSVAPAAASDPDNVMALANAITAAGVDLYLECPEGAGFAGLYASQYRGLAVCAGGLQPSSFDPEQQDTLRHEGIHLAQDCMDRPFDGELETTRTISSVIQLMAEASDTYNFAQIEHSYRQRGADDMTILLEFEAWAGAAVFTNLEVADLVRRACRVS